MGGEHDVYTYTQALWTEEQDALLAHYQVCGMCVDMLCVGYVVCGILSPGVCGMLVCVACRICTLCSGQDWQ